LFQRIEILVTLRKAKKLKINNFRDDFEYSLPKTFTKHECAVLSMYHHATCYIIRNDTVIYFDPCGQKSLEEIKKYLIKTNNLFRNKVVVFNKKRIQPKLSNMCGHLCLIFLKLKSDKSISDIKTVVRYIDKNKIELIKTMLF
jgi:hypothetical protein